ncbi:RNA polymerase Rpb1 domain 2 family protein (apicoplast) [Theileria parva strain Muguga]|uniref:DNA-directed RNA polymerase n=1 Tax=Theileria parva TaxID=5875 RepID=Q4MY94_THEPA|nr:RNA polymerase Rpb1 domain 2 family protein [Theileria parva strain Muguga]|eukprot:XP_762698.1 DNA-directed RNA polymerase subunit beta' (apicoplast) [Theileria parva strain Muguga]
MISYSNIDLSLLTPENLSDLIIRKYYNNCIIGIVINSSNFLHKKKRFRYGGLFCEEIFGLLYVCLNERCVRIYKFNDNPILNKLCLNCKKNMIFNYKRKYRFGSIFLHFPILNDNYFNDFIKLLKMFKKMRQEYFKITNKFKVANFNFFNNIFFNSKMVKNKFLNFIDLLYKITCPLELFKMKFNLCDKKKPTVTEKFHKFIKLLNNFSDFKKIFLTLFPILPAGLRIYSFDNRRQPVNSGLNALYKCIIDFNNSINITCDVEYNLKYIFILHIVIKAILDFSKQKNIFKQKNDLYNKLHGKYGVFRQNLLGYRVDYSGRSTIVPGPSLSLDIIGLPFNMLCHYVRRNDNIYMENKFYESSLYTHYAQDKFDFFEYYLDMYSVIANRAPTLHKMNVQTFKPIFVEGESIKLMPLLCVGYNADFDGDQMGIFSLVKYYSITESFNMLRSLVNLHSPTTKKSVFNLTQGMLSGYYTLSNYNYLTLINNYVSSNYMDALECCQNNILINSPMLLRSCNMFYLTTVGRLLIGFNRFVL